MILALDTSGAISVAVCDGDTVLAEATEFAPRSHAELLASMIRDTMAAAGIAGTDVGRIVAGTGPAPFTGLRVGLMTAAALGLAWSVPVLGACSLDALGAQHGGRVTVVTDARRREVYWATYDAGARVLGPTVSSPDSVAVGQNDDRDVVGRGVALYPEAFAGRSTTDDVVDPQPAWLARVVARAEASGEVEFPIQPLYLRRPDSHGMPPA